MRKIEAYKLASRQGETPLSDLRAFWILMLNRRVVFHYGAIVVKKIQNVIFTIRGPNQEGARGTYSHS